MKTKPVVNAIQANEPILRAQELLGFGTGIIGILAKFLCIVVLMHIGTTSLLAQGSNATLGGRVFDPQSRVVRNASVTVTSVETGNQWHSTTNKDGDW